MPKNSLKLLALTFFVWVTGCVTGVKVTEVTQPLDEVRAAIQTVANDFKWMSSNRRKFESKYFPRKPKKNFDPMTASERVFARFSIIGDRRPYQILVEAIIEQKQDGEYIEVGEDLEIAEKLAQEVAESLTKGREGRNAIDSFRAF